MSDISHIVRLAAALANHRRRSPSTIGRWASGDGRFYSRLAGGHDITIRRAVRIMQWFSDHWPSDLAWPPDIPRPAPSASVTQPSEYRNGNPAPAPATAPADLMESVTCMLDAGDEPAAIECAMALNAKGLLASPNALCQALRVERYVYDQVVKRYADGRPGEHKLPRRLLATTRSLPASACCSRWSRPATSAFNPGAGE